MKDSIETLLETHRPTQSSAARERMLKEVTTTLSTPSVVPSPYERFVPVVRSRMLVVVTCLMLLVSTSVGTVAAAESARPGDLLFPLDRATEELRLLLASDEAKVALNTAFLDERLSELEAVIIEETNRVSDTTLAKHDDTVSAAREERIVAALQTFLDQADTLSDEQVDDRLRTARNLVHGIDNERLKIKFEDDRFEIRTDNNRIRIKDEDRKIEVRARDEDDYDGDHRGRGSDNQEDIGGVWSADGIWSDDDDRDDDRDNRDDDRDNRDDDDRDDGNSSSSHDETTKDDDQEDVGGSDSDDDDDHDDDDRDGDDDDPEDEDKSGKHGDDR